MEPRHNLKEKCSSLNVVSEKVKRSMDISSPLKLDYFRTAKQPEMMVAQIILRFKQGKKQSPHVDSEFVTG